MQDTMKEYVKLAAQIAEEQKEYFIGPLDNDVFQCSPMLRVTYFCRWYTYREICG